MRKGRFYFAVAVLMAPSALGAQPALTLDLGGGVGLELVLVKAGRFTQGSPEREAGRASDEIPREVVLTRDFYIGRYEVTVAQWSRFVAEARYRSEAEKGRSGGFGWDGRSLVQSPAYDWRTPGYAGGGRRPVTIVTYDDALAFTRWLTQRSGRTVTLPTEAQWEYAARGGTTTRFYAGEPEQAAGESGWFKGNAPDGPRDVGLKRPNAFGLYDTAGNVYEWCLDWYGPYEPAAASDPLETRSNLSDRPRRVLRGGSWLKDVRALRAAARYRNTPGSRNADNGFRVLAGPASHAAAAEAPPRTGAAAGRPAAAAPGSWLAGLAGATVLAVPGALCLGVSAVVLIALLRRRRARTRVGPDGFTLYVPGAQVGQRLHYRYRMGGVVNDGQITVTGDPGDGVFVYTGDRPSAVELLSAGAIATAVATAPQARPVLRERDEPFRGYPSAY